MLDFWSRDIRDFQTYRRSDRAIAYVPTETDCPTAGCGWDPVMQGGKNPFDPVCGGKGKIQTWVTYQLTCRLNWPKSIQFAYPYPTTGVELADCIITVLAEYREILTLVQNNERAYIVADGKTVRPKIEQPMIVPGIIEEYEYVCYLHTPE